VNEPMDNPEALARHPEDVDLVAFADGLLDDLEARTVVEHVANCAECTAAIADLDAPLDPLALGVAVALPADLSALFQDPAGDPQPSELWSLEWESATLLALVLDVDGKTLTVAPVTFEEPSDPVATVVPAVDSPIDAPMFVWHRLARQVPLGVFLAPAGELPVAYVNDEPSTATFGEDTALLMADLATAAGALAEARTLVVEAGATLEAAAMLPELLRHRVPSEIKAATGITTAAVTELRRGDRSPTDEEAELLASYFGVSADTLRGQVPVPSPLAWAIERPMHRRHIRARAVGEGVTEMSMRRTVAEGVMPLAARTTGAAERDVAAWDELVRHYLDE
jgi:transcriptional regulator with XRE-family HTH domain